MNRDMKHGKASGTENLLGEIIKIMFYTNSQIFFHLFRTNSEMDTFRRFVK